jgi:hypothetical protein
MGSFPLDIQMLASLFEFLAIDVICSFGECSGLILRHLLHIYHHCYITELQTFIYLLLCRRNKRISSPSSGNFLQIRNGNSRDV